MDIRSPLSPHNFATPTQPSKYRRVSGRSSQLSIPASPFMKKLGYGTGVMVYLYERSPAPSGYRSPWAIKKVNSKTKHLSRDMECRLKKEANILKELNHVNIVGFRGLGQTPDGSFCLSMENGEKSLRDLIDEREEFGDGAFAAREIYQVAVSVAEGLNYLHNEKKLLHGDLKSANVLITGDFESIKICDFGVALALKDDLSGLKRKSDFYIGSEPWKCKEAINGDEITDKADMYAYGLIIWEMMTLSVPHTDLLDYSTNDDSQDSSYNEDLFNEALGSRPPLPDEEKLLKEPNYQPLIQLFHTCTEENPKKRPSVSQALEALKSLQMNYI
ncbi:lymphokine-activated killer T-cell-originated protein kinase homolog [Saccoglossus kowalevskii]|uniref:Lymphokine-activated killer T-cell-originated protein kinase homolog n=1 Tax=Saccoglossus kowalevskii TaxID=10224 RepID=A0ABM0MW70_SACKO|nr:PREDICTED: lymphokine-activated killer T-cell-originated protein kinase homolog [Saccoglossus kowalevskii]